MLRLQISITGLHREENSSILGSLLILNRIPAGTRKQFPAILIIRRTTWVITSGPKLRPRIIKVNKPNTDYQTKASNKSRNLSRFDIPSEYALQRLAYFPHGQRLVRLGFVHRRLILSHFHKFCLDPASIRFCLSRDLLKWCH